MFLHNSRPLKIEQSNSMSQKPLQKSFAENVQDRRRSCDKVNLLLHVDVPFSHADWRGRIRASAGIRASLPPEAVERFDIELAAVLAERFPDEPLAVPHRVWAASGIKS